MDALLSQQSILQENVWLIIALSLWTIPWKGVALWKAARNRSKIWFIVLLLVNTVAILEILYIFIFSRRNSAEGKKDKAGGDTTADKQA